MFRLFGAALFVPMILAPFLVPSPVFAVTCPPNSRPLASGERERAVSLGVTIPAGSECIDNRTAQWLDQRIDEDIAFFNSRICPGKTAGLPSDFNRNDDSVANWNRIRSDNGYVYFSAGSTGMNPGALRCFRRFFEAIEQADRAASNPNDKLEPCVNAAFRSPAHQRASCMAPGNSVVCGRSGRGTGPVNSCPSDLSAYSGCAHTSGIAMDINAKSNVGNREPQKLQRLLAEARRFSGFSKVGAGAADPWHIEAGNCAEPNVRPPTTYVASGPGTNAPLGLGNMTRDMFGMQQPPPYMGYQQPLTSGTGIMNSFGQQTASLNPIASAPVQTQTQTQGASGLLVTNSATNTNVNTNTNTNIASNPISSQLQELAFGSGSAATSSGSLATSVPVVVTGATAGSLAYVEGQQPSVQSTTSIGGLPVGQQTFTASTPLTPQGANTLFAGPDASRFQQILTTLRTALLMLLDYIRPFSSTRYAIEGVQGDPEGF